MATDKLIATKEHLEGLIKLYGTNSVVKLVKRMQRDIRIIDPKGIADKDTKTELGYSRIGADNWK